jgi:predicted MFS family arabinose efflux permease
VRPLLPSHPAGGARRRAVLVLAGVLALNAADSSTIGAVGPMLQKDLGFGNAQLGLLASASALFGALATIPVGSLTDRVHRTRLLAGSIVVWGVAMVATALAPDFGWLLLAQLCLGAVTATAGPVVASLVGDMFPSAERGRVWGDVLSGELVGAGLGLVGCGLVAGIVGWRWAFGVLAAAGLLLAAAVRRLPEPARRVPVSGAGPPVDAVPVRADDLAQREVLAAGVRPEQGSTVLPPSPEQYSLLTAVRVVLRVRTNVRLVIASSFGYFFFTGIQVFGLTFLRSRYGLDQVSASLLMLLVGGGAFAGVLLGGRTGDRLLRRGRLAGRILAAVGASLVAVVALTPAVLTTAVAVAAPFLLVGAAGLGAVNPPLDAARLDIVPGRLWGRAEAVRTVLRSAGNASAPLLFGWVSERLAGPQGVGLERTFLLMLVPLLVGVVAMLAAARSYPGDVAAVAAAERACAVPGEGGPGPVRPGERAA